MARSLQTVTRSRVLRYFFAAGAFALLSGCMTAQTAHVQRPMPRIDPEAAAILAENTLSSSRGVKLSASDDFGRILEVRHTAYVRARAKQDVMLTEVQAD